MYSKLQEAFVLLTSKERRQFEGFTRYRCDTSRLPYADFQPLFSLLNNKKLTLDLIPVHARELYEGSDPLQKMQRRMSQLYQMWEHFVCFELQDVKPAFQQLALSSFFRERNQQERSLSFLHQKAKATEKVKNLHASQHLSLYYNYSEQYEMLSTTQRRTDLKINEAIDHFSKFTIYHGLKWACLALSHTHVSGQEYSTQFIEPMKQLLELQKAKEISSEIKAFELALKLISSENDHASFEKLNHILLNEKLNLGTDRKNIFLFAINYCIQQANHGERSFIKEAFELYQWGLENHLLLENDIISKYTYRNIINHGFALNEMIWVRSFMDEYKKHLHPSDQENSYQYNLARWYFRQGQYDEVLTILRNVDFDDIGYNIDGRRMLAKIYWEGKQHQVLYSFLDTFKIYLIRHQKQFQHYRAFSTFIKFLKKMIQLEMMSNNQKRDILKKIQAAQPFIDQKWMIEKVQSVL